MYQLKEAITFEEKKIVADQMQGVGNPSAEKTWGYWDGDNCLGGINLFNLSNRLSKDNFSIGFTVIPNFNLGYVIYASVCEALKITPRLTAKVKITNVKSRKGARQLGFSPLYVEDGYEYLELYKPSNHLHERWKNYV